MKIRRIPEAVALRLIKSFKCPCIQRLQSDLFRKLVCQRKVVHPAVSGISYLIYRVFIDLLFLRQLNRRLFHLELHVVRLIFYTQLKKYFRRLSIHISKGKLLKPRLREISCRSLLFPEIVFPGSLVYTVLIERNRQLSGNSVSVRSNPKCIYSLLLFIKDFKDCLIFFRFHSCYGFKRLLIKLCDFENSLYHLIRNLKLQFYYRDVFSLISKRKGNRICQKVSLQRRFCKEISYRLLIFPVLHHRDIKRLGYSFSIWSRRQRIYNRSVLQPDFKDCPSQRLLRAAVCLENLNNTLYPFIQENALGRICDFHRRFCIIFTYLNIVCLFPLCRIAVYVIPSKAFRRHFLHNPESAFILRSVIQPFCGLIMSRRRFLKPDRFSSGHCICRSLIRLVFPGLPVPFIYGKACSCHRLKFFVILLIKLCLYLIRFVFKIYRNRTVCL